MYLVNFNSYVCFVSLASCPSSKSKDHEFEIVLIFYVFDIYVSFHKLCTSFMWSLHPLIRNIPYNKNMLYTCTKNITSEIRYGQLHMFYIYIFSLEKIMQSMRIEMWKVARVSQRNFRLLQWNHMKRKYTYRLPPLLNVTNT